MKLLFTYSDLKREQREMEIIRLVKKIQSFIRALIAARNKSFCYEGTVTENYVTDWRHANEYNNKNNEQNFPDKENSTSSAYFNWISSSIEENFLKL